MKIKINDRDFILYNGIVFSPWDRYQGGLAVKDGKIWAVFKGPLPTHFNCGSFETVDCLGSYIFPGFIDIHLHGGIGIDFSTAGVKEIKKAALYHAACGGTTALLPTIVSAPMTEIKAAVERIRLAGMNGRGPQIIGAHLEGPFINPSYKGALPVQHLREPEPNLVDEILNYTGGLPTMITLAPELPHGLEAVAKFCRQGLVVALGHSGATYEQVLEAIDRGLSHAVHTYSAMQGFHHRDPGTLGAVLTADEISAELIADGIHTAPAAVKLFFRAKPAEKAVLVTDAIAGSGLPDGEYFLGNEKIKTCSNKAFLKNGTLAGSTLTMNRALAGAIEMSAKSIEDVLPAATINPARVMGLAGQKGSLEEGKDADIVLVDPAFKVLLTICQGYPCVGSQDSTKEMTKMN